MFKIYKYQFLRFIFFLFTFIFLISLCSAGTYGANNYGDGDYGIGYVAPSVTPAGGGGGGITTPIQTFEIDKDLFHVILKQGETKRETLTIKNNLDKNLTINLNYSELSDFLIISEESFTLIPGESKTINADFFAREEEIPEAYTGRIIVQSGTTQKIVNVIVEVKERKPLFDLRIDVKNKKLLAGNKIDFKILTINQGDLTGFDILMHYSIKDFEGNIYELKEESIKIDKELEVERSLIVPQNISLGRYILYSKISYGNITATGIDTFEVMSKEALNKYKTIQFIIIMLIIIVSLILLWIIIRKRITT